MRRLSVLVALLLIGLGVGLDAVPAGNDGFVSMFNGKDLAGWVNVNCAPNTFHVKDGMIVTTGIPTGYLRTHKQYENFILEFDWFHAPAKKGDVGNSGLFVWGDPLPAKGTGYTRSIEVQVLVNLEVKDKYTSQGDLFSIWGATCKPDRPHPMGWERCLPSENRCKGEYEWNHYRVEANDGALKLAVNGKVVSGVSQCNPRKGYLALESEGSECRFKNLKIKELPSTNPKPGEICDVDQGFTCLFTGIDLAGWKTAGDDTTPKQSWIMRDGVLSNEGKKAKTSPLLSEKSYRDFEMICDWKLNSPGESGFILRGRKGLAEIGADQKGSPWNRSLIRMKGDRLTTYLNGKLVIDDMPRKDVPASGPIGLYNQGDRAQFRNLFIRELASKE